MSTTTEEENVHAGGRGKKSGIFPAVIFTLIMTGIITRYPVYYDLNDDVMIARIVSGRYSGEPLLHDIQNLFPFSAFTALVSRTGFTAFYGTVLLALQILTILIVMVRIGSRARRQSITVILDVLTVFLYLSVLYTHLVNLQYSVTVGMMAGAAAFLFMTDRPLTDYKPGTLLRHILPQLLLIWAGFLIRSEMMMFMAPLVLVAILFNLFFTRQSYEKTEKRSISENCSYEMAQKNSAPETCSKKKKFTFSDRMPAGFITFIWICIFIFGGLGAEKSADLIACSSGQWRTFNEWFDLRTDLYDFQGLPDYDKWQSEYEQIGVSKEEYNILSNYNIALLSDFDNDRLRAVDKMAESVRLQKVSGSYRLYDAWKRYITGQGNTRRLPQTLATAFLYPAAAAAALCLYRKNRHKAGEGAARRFLKAVLIVELMLFFARSMLWIYLLYWQRPVERLTDSIFITEDLILFTLLFGGNLVPAFERNAGALQKKEGAGKEILPVISPAMNLSPVPVLALCAVLCAGAWLQGSSVKRDRDARALANRPYSELMTYCADNPDAFVFVDVYSSVDFSEPVYDDFYTVGDGKACNWELLGGWICNSPLYRDKLEKFGMDNAFEGLLQDNVLLAAERESDVSWLEAYYQSRGRNVTLKKTGKISDYWYIYKAEENS